MDALNLLSNYIAKLAGGGLCIAFSGGVDSALLLKAACDSGAEVHAVTLFTPFHSPLEPEQAREMALAFGAVHRTIRLEEMPPEVMANTPDRCYLCKRVIFEHITAYAEKQELRHILDGTNAADLTEYRPGLRALSELGIKSPLAELGLDKAAVRQAAAQLGLGVADKPSAPCLATRFPYGCLLEPDQLQKVEGIESFVRSLGIRQVRARVQGGVVRLEVQREDFAAVLDHRDELLNRVLQEGYVTLDLDLGGFRSGSMDRLYRWEQEHQKKGNGQP